MLAITAVGPSIVLVVVDGEDPTVNVPLPVALAKVSVPVLVAATPKVGVIVHEDAVVDVVFGIAPTTALVAFVPP